MNVVVDDALINVEISLDDSIVSSVLLDDNNFIIVIDNDIMNVIIDDGVCC